jgi:hypothetical protein
MISLDHTLDRWTGLQMKNKSVPFSLLIRTSINAADLFNFPLFSLIFFILPMNQSANLTYLVKLWLFFLISEG